MLIHGSTSDEALAEAQKVIDETGHTGATYYTSKTLNLAETNGSLTVGDVEAPSDTVINFGKNSMLIVDSTVMNGQEVFTYGGESATGGIATVADSSTLYVANAKYEDSFTVFGTGFDTKPAAWTNSDNVMTDTDMLTATYDEENSTVTISVNDAQEVYPDLSDDLATAVTDLYIGKLNNVYAEEQGVRFLSRATNNRFLGSDKQAAASTIESAAHMAFAAAVPQMTKMASDAATNAVVNRLGFANPDNGAKAMNMEGKLVDDKALGLALWIAPLWSNQTGFGMEAGNLDYGYNAKELSENN